jgi:uncharacterized protein (TIGR03067 family)
MRTLLALAFTLITACGIAADTPKHDDQKAIQGTWTVETATNSGQPVADINGELIFDGDKFTIRDKAGTERKSTFKLEPGSKPKAMLVKPENNPPNSSPGHYAYELNGDSLKLAISPPDKKPTEISDKGQILITLKRKKDK